MNILNKIIQHDVSKPFPLEDGSVDVVITSPPYWGLRDYGEEAITVWGGDSSCEHQFEIEEIEINTHLNADFNERCGDSSGQRKQEKSQGFKTVRGFCIKCNAWKGQLGLEPHPQLFLEHLWQIFDECKRVLGHHGSIYVNLGDTYCGSWGGFQKTEYTGIIPKERMPNDTPPQARIKKNKGWLQPKQLLLIPSRFAIGMQERGWILRNDLIWNKPNAMPSSIKDRCNNTYEHIFHFTKSGEYQYNLDAVREPHSESSKERHKYPFNHLPRAWEGDNTPLTGGSKANFKLGEGGKNPGDILEFDDGQWSDFIHGTSHTNKKYKQALKIMKRWMTENKCQDYNKFYEWWKEESKGKWKSGDLKEGQGAKIDGSLPFPKPETRFIGKNPGDILKITTKGSPEAHYSVFPEELVKRLILPHSPETVVLDPFSGRGTSGKVAKELGCDYILFDISEKNIEIASRYLRRSNTQKYRKMEKRRNAPEVIKEKKKKFKQKKLK